MNYQHHKYNLFFKLYCNKCTQDCKENREYINDYDYTIKTNTIRNITIVDCPEPIYQNLPSPQIYINKIICDKMNGPAMYTPKSYIYDKTGKKRTNTTVLLERDKFKINKDCLCYLLETKCGNLSEKELEKLADNPNFRNCIKDKEIVKLILPTNFCEQIKGKQKCYEYFDNNCNESHA